MLTRNDWQRLLTRQQHEVKGWERLVREADTAMAKKIYGQLLQEEFDLLGKMRVEMEACQP